MFPSFIDLKYTILLQIYVKNSKNHQKFNAVISATNILSSKLIIMIQSIIIFYSLTSWFMTLWADKFK